MGVLIPKKKKIGGRLTPLCVLLAIGTHYGVSLLPPHQSSRILSNLPFQIFWFFPSSALFSCCCLNIFGSLDFFKLDIYGCLVSIGSKLMKSGGAVVKMSCLKGRWCSIENYVAPFLEYQRNIIEPFFCRVDNPPYFNVI